MADILDLLSGAVLGPRGIGGVVGSQSIIFPPPGDTGGISGIVNDILQRIPIPRPRLPAPRGPGVPQPRGRIPIPVPIPDIFGIFNGEGGCPGCCKGMHLNKQETKDGSPAGTKCVTNRRMNSLNPRALKRATRRLKGFERAVVGTRKQLRTLAKI